jgi:transcriptional regulator with XRE-family HTH domain
MPRLSFNNIDWKKSVYKLRIILGCSQEDLARHLDKTTSSISKWERGESIPQLRSIRYLKSFALSKRLVEDQWLVKVEAKAPKLVKGSHDPNA